MKLPNNTGSCYKLTGKRRKPWAAVITTGWTQLFDDDGKPQGKPKQERKLIGTFATRKEALKALMDYNDQTPTPVHEQPVTVLKQGYVPTLRQLWKEIRKVKEVQLSRNTLNNYDNSFKRCSALHEKRVDTITYMDLQKEMNKFMEEGKTAGSLKLYKVFFTMVFEEAVKMDYISRNPAKHVTYKATKEKQKKNAIPPDILKKIYASDLPSRDAVIILTYTGLRINELLKVKELKDGYFITGSKTEAGKDRIVPIHPQIKDILEKWVRTPHLGYTTLATQLEADCNVWGYKFTFHECRHTFISLANKYGMNIITLKKMVGHATTDVTENVYVHVDVEGLQAEINKIPMISDL